MNRTARNLIALAGILIVAGCSQPPLRIIPGPSPARLSAQPMASVQPIAPIAPAVPGAAASAGQAEAACLAQGRAQGLSVQGVVGTREVTAADGSTSARDVMLRVARGQQVYEVRCNYSYASAEARIMSL